MATGWFYVYDAVQYKILGCTHVYDRSNVAVDADEVDVGWSTDESVCGVAVFGQFRAFLGATNDLHIRKPIRGADEDGIYAGDWPKGFEHYLKKEID